MLTSVIIFNATLIFYNGLLLIKLYGWVYKLFKSLALKGIPRHFRVPKSPA